MMLAVFVFAAAFPVAIVTFAVAAMVFAVLVLSAAFPVAVFAAAVVFLFHLFDFLFGHWFRLHHLDFEV